MPNPAEKKSKYLATVGYFKCHFLRCQSKQYSLTYNRIMKTKMGKTYTYFALILFLLFLLVWKSVLPRQKVRANVFRSSGDITHF